MTNKSEFITYYAETNQISKRQATEEIERFSETFKSCTIVNGGINLMGFMKSEVVDVTEKECRNPKTGEKFISPAHKVVKVKLSKSFKNMED